MHNCYVSKFYSLAFLRYCFLYQYYVKNCCNREVIFYRSGTVKYRKKQNFVSFELSNLNLGNYLIHSISLATLHQHLVQPTNDLIFKFFKVGLVRWHSLVTKGIIQRQPKISILKKTWFLMLEMLIFSILKQ